MKITGILFVLMMLSLDYLVKVQDWANLKKYQTENAILKNASTDRSRIVFMGNSITEGWIKQRPNFFCW